MRLDKKEPCDVIKLGDVGKETPYKKINLLTSHSSFFSDTLSSLLSNFYILTVSVDSKGLHLFG